MSKKTVATKPGMKALRTKAALQSEAPDDKADFALVESAVTARKQRLYQSAREILTELIKRRSDWRPARVELLQLLLALEDFAEAEKLLQTDLRQFPDDRSLWITLGMVRSRTGNAKGEMEALARALKLEVEPSAAKRLFDLQRDGNDYAGALKTVELLRGLKDATELKVVQCRLLGLLNKREETLQMCEALFELTPIPAGAVEQWCTLHLANRNEPEKVVGKFAPMIAAGREEPALYQGLSRGLHRMDRSAEAAVALKKALAANPEQAQGWYDLSVIQRQIGEIADSQASMMRSLEVAPMNPTALRVHGVEHKYVYGDEAYRMVNLAHAAIDSFTPEKRVEMHFAVAKAAEDVGELACAFKHYELAGKLQATVLPYRHVAAQGLMKMVRHRVGRATYANFTPPRCESDRAVFVLGMPRSGTSLAEQIIASHPEAYGAGELKLLHRVVDGISINGRVIQTSNESGAIPTYIPGLDVSDCRKLDFKQRGELYVKAIEAIAAAAGRPDVKRVVDKMPGNYYWTGLIPFIMPNAKIVHTTRHPMDNCLSLYRIFFPDGMPWSYDLVNLGKVYRAYHEHMLHWEKGLPEGAMITVHYETVVADIETQARRIISHIGLDWNDACLRFYETDRPVKTASLSQVRQPIYNTSVGRWRKYEEFMKPLIRELGPLVKEYEGFLENDTASAKTGV